MRCEGASCSTAVTGRQAYGAAPVFFDLKAYSDSETSNGPLVYCRAYGQSEMKPSRFGIRMTGKETASNA